MEKLIVRAKIQIAEAPASVYNAIVDPQQMKNYFIEWGSKEMQEGSVVQWKFPEMEDRFNVEVVTLRPPDCVVFNWGDEAGATNVTIEIESVEENSSVVTITEKEKQNSESGLVWMRENTEGWANFLACLKAWLEYGINLRKGAFDFMRKRS